jgi:general secretion pathway protein B
MSLILDALRRAESQRQSQSQIQPALSLPGGPAGERPRRPWPAVATVCAALVIVAAALALTAGLWQAGDGTTGAAGQDRRLQPARSAAGTTAPHAATAALDERPAPAAPRTGPSAEPAPATLRTGGQRPDLRSLAEEARAGRPPAASVAAAPGNRSTAAPDASRAPPRPAPGTVRIVAPGTDTEIVPPAGGRSAAAVAPGSVVIRDLLAEEGMPSNGRIAIAGGGRPDAGRSLDGRVAAGSDGTTALPAGAAGGDGPPASAPDDLGDLAAAPAEFKLNMLSTGRDPAARYVYINMRRYRIGDETPEGAMIEDINNRGAVIAWRGERFLLTLR